MSKKANFKRLLRKFLVGSIDDAELEVLQKELKDSPENLESARKSYFGFIKLAGLERSAVWLDQNRKEVQRRIVRRRRFTQGLKVAASLLAIIGLSGVLHLSGIFNTTQEWKTVTAANGEIKEFYLSDSSRIYLAPSSTLKFPVKFSKDCRQVQLNGEAYFEVKKDTERKFIVKTSFSEVNVLGTSFNVRAYPNERYEETLLVEGVVSLTHLDEKKNKIHQPYILEPFEKVKYNKEDNTTERKIIDSKNKPVWMNHRIAFYNQSLSFVAKELERFHNVTIVIVDEGVGKIKINGEFNNESLEEILNSLKILLPSVCCCIHRKNKISFRRHFLIC
jgi:ferric-dicitrate binding protein FerR (iron transport regulator)